MQCDGACEMASVEDVEEIAGCLAQWPPSSFEWVLPRINPRLLVCCQKYRLPHAHSSSAIALRSAATAALLDAAIRREEDRYRALRAAASDKAATDEDAERLALIDVHSDWGQYLSTSSPPSLPSASLLFSHDRALAAEPLGAPVFERDLATFELNLDAFTNGLLRGLDMSGCVLAGGAVLACVLRAKIPTSARSPSPARSERASERASSSAGDCPPTAGDFTPTAGGSTPPASSPCSPPETSSPPTCGPDAAALAMDDEERLVEVEARRAFFEPAHHEHCRRGTSRSYEGKVDDGDGGSESTRSPFATSSDVDLFLVGLSAEQALAKVRAIHRVLRRNYHGSKLLVKTGSAITFVAGGFPQRFVQAQTPPRHFS